MHSLGLSAFTTPWGHLVPVPEEASLPSKANSLQSSRVETFMAPDSLPQWKDAYLSQGGKPMSSSIKGTVDVS